MKYNWHPNKVAFLDVETQSECDLNAHGRHQYFAHESTQVLTCCICVDGEMHEFGPYLDAEAKRRMAAVTEGRTIVAHNAPFDASAWEMSGLPERTWYDTLGPARAAGLPGGLDKLSQMLGGRGKDKNGPRLVEMLCCVKQGRIPAIGPAHGLLMRYNKQDVEELELIYERVKSFGEPEVMDVDFAVNMRGIPVDREMLQQLRELFARNAELADAAFAKATGNVNPRSPKQCKDWMEQNGFRVPGLNKVVYDQFLTDPEQFYIGDDDAEAALDIVSEAMEHRREVVRVGRGKADAMLGVLDEDDRIRDQLVYYGAHTGRWSGRKMQPHNMPKVGMGAVRVRDLPLTLEAMQKASAEASTASGRRIPVADALNACLRHLVRCDSMLVADYASVEARCLAWIAGESEQLELYKDPSKSVYVDLGSKLFGRKIDKKADPTEYDLAKALVLGCGYGMSGVKFAYTCRTRGVDISALDKLGIDVKDSVKFYRETYPRIVASWAAFHRALHDAVAGIPTEVGHCKLYMLGADLRMELPSGRCIIYRDAHVEMTVPLYCKMYGMPEVAVPTVIFKKPRGMGFLYGSRLVENCLGPDTGVLTARGVVRICEVQSADAVWDGDAWVRTDGAICNGQQEVMEWQGVITTPNHTTFDGRRWWSMMHLDEERTGCIQRWAADSAPWSSRSKNSSATAERRSSVAIAVALSDARTSTFVRRMPQLAAADARLRAGQRARRLALGEARLQTRRCGACGRTVGLASCLDATIHPLKRIAITELAASGCIKHGSMIRRSSSDTPSRCPNGTMRCLRSTGSVTMETTSQAISGWSQWLLTATTGDALCTSCLKESCNRGKSFAESTSAIWRKAQQCSTSNMSSSRVYDLLNCGPRNRFTIVTKNGLAIVHNCSQAICRDFVADALVNCESAGLQPFLHVHDEICNEAGDDRFIEFMELMSTPPAWADGFPLTIEGYVGPIWSKDTHGYREAIAMNGKILKDKR